MSKRCSLALLAWVSLIALEARGDGLVYQLPEDGAWQRFHTVSRSDQTGMERTGSLTISSVGTATVNNQKFRWIELKMESAQEPKRTTITKLLIPEQALKKGENPLAQAMRGWQKRDGEQPQTYDSASNRQRFLQVFLCEPLQQEKKIDKRAIDYQPGRLECEGISGQVQVTEGEFKATRAYQTWLHEKVPFGVAAAKIEIKGERNGQAFGVTMDVTVTDVGKNAVSELPGNQ